MVILLVSAFGCGKKDAGSEIPRDKLLQIYTEMVFTEERYRQLPERFPALRDSLFQAHGTDSAAFRQSMLALTDDPKELQRFYEDAIALMEARTKPKK